MREYIYKILIFVVAIIVVFEFTVGKQISQINEKVNYFTSSDGRKQMITSLKEEIKKANEKENYLKLEEMDIWSFQLLCRMLPLKKF